MSERMTDKTLVSRAVCTEYKWAHHGQTTSKQRCIDVTDVDTTLF